MQRLRFFLIICVLAVFLAACAPGTATVPPAQPVTVDPSATPVFEPTLAVDPTATTVSEPGSVSPTPEVQPVATSRGPDLHATDPTTVSLASGGLQFVEFFRFT